MRNNIFFLFIIILKTLLFVLKKIFFWKNVIKGVFNFLFLFSKTKTKTTELYNVPKALACFRRIQILDSNSINGWPTANEITMWRLPKSSFSFSSLRKLILTRDISGSASSPSLSIWRRKKEMSKESLMVAKELKRLQSHPVRFDRFIKSHVSRLLKSDLVSVLAEFQRQDQVFLCMKVTYWSLLFVVHEFAALKIAVWGLIENLV